MKKSEPNYILEEARELKEPKENGETIAWSNIGYYSNWAQVFYRATWKVTEDSGEIKDIQTFMNAFDSAKQEILAAINNAGLEG